MSTICETIMLVCFGLSWPFAVIKSLKSKTAKGKSIYFQSAILLGYIAGIIGKAAVDNYSYVFWLYVLNTTLVAFDTFLYFRNAERDMKLERENKAMLLNYDLSSEPEKAVESFDEYEEGLCLAKAVLDTNRSQNEALEFDQEEQEGMTLAKASLTHL